jgi:hypothetical protein
MIERLVLNLIDGGTCVVLWSLVQIASRPKAAITASEIIRLQFGKGSKAGIVFIRPSKEVSERHFQMANFSSSSQFSVFKVQLASAEAMRGVIASEMYVPFLRSAVTEDIVRPTANIHLASP